jgi:DNA-binding MurR/RpiR family transcriptional regulator
VQRNGSSRKRVPRSKHDGARGEQSPTERIRRLASSLAPAMLRVAEVIQDDPAGSAYLSGPALARRAGVSQATVVRFAQALGYSGYPAFLDAHRREVSARPTVEKLQGTFPAGDEPIWRQVMLADLENITRTMAELDPDEFERAVKLLAGSRRVYIWGVRTTSALGDLLEVALTYLLGAASVIRLGPTLYQEQLLEAGPKDVAIVASFPRYLNLSVTAAQFAREQRLKVIAITDSVLSPIAEGADCVLCAHSELLSFTESLAAPVSLANALLTALALARRSESLATLKRVERLWAKRGIHHSNGRRPGPRSVLGI